MKNNWILKEKAIKEDIKRLVEELNIPEVIACLLIKRGITTYEEARSFFRPHLEQLHNPFLMKDMQKSVERIERAITKKERILIFGDYDVDGTSAVALMYSFLKQFDVYLEYYIPDRYIEGYGISSKSVEYAKEHTFSLIISLDCGIKCHSQIDLANQYGIDVVVCDHHLPDSTLPKAYSILNPKRTDCSYPYKELSGCGVGFKLIQAIALYRNIPFNELIQYLDLVVISIASDIVSITGENRILAYYGLKLINSNPRQGIEFILSFSNIFRRDYKIHPPTRNIFNKEITINDLVFLVGPRINAAGRMNTGRNSVHLLICNKEKKVSELGELIDNHNSERRELDSKTTIQAIEQIKNNTNFEHSRSLVVYNPDWSKGVIGIVASRLVEQFYKPTVVLTLFDGIITGSARSVKGFDLYHALSQCSHLLEHFGGHTFAAGLSLKPENLHAFIETFENIVSSSILQESINPVIDIDEEIDLKDINENFYAILKQFAPFGPGNMMPVFMTKNVLDSGKARIVGQKHLKLSVFQSEKRSFPMDAIAFGFGDYYNKIIQRNPFHICYHVELNAWQGRKILQLCIKDIKFDD
ncbi:MAG: single-stranded-DNA-specific exonuclease RecJ [Bacteroidales bacterium]|jgi:single-stranded-DNA-specific exonuclease|nr:single-stranded-DNA-specific exonuclease RecJ [Bacteroidales bacterium]MDD2686963.1 single-stranded-DNA-specific exonuclease RecJ [Bacteroidales bacterium]MDD3330114.1 single-stranded-DNA-specific exonuclease RecJ [Bacteroidales bacterium]MDD3690875.1 single-stranded-DNA-specific exonuclease RecJ [Bacteroidales bacterium]MDD4044675.1 single-stranded-DNA-specific exonuclease RecJ [Bacteroidales bacterium]